MGGKFVVTKPKNVDTIVSKNSKAKSAEPNLDENKPLLSILTGEGETISGDDIVAKRSQLSFFNRKKLKAGDAKKATKKKQPKTNVATQGDTKKPRLVGFLKRLFVKVEGKTGTKTEKPILFAAANKIGNTNSEEGFLKKRHKIMIAVVGTTSTLLVLVGLIGGAAYAHQAIYENKIFPGVMVWGEDVGGKSVSEVQELINEKAKAYNIVIKGPDQDYKATVSDLGIIFNSDSMALSAYSRGRSDVWWEDYLTRGRLLFTEIKWTEFQDFIRSSDLAISPSYTIDQNKLDTYLQEVASNINIKAQDSVVTVEGVQTKMTPAIYGRDVEYEALKNSVIANINGLKTEKIEVPTKTIKPAIIDTAAESVVLQAQNVMARPVVLTYKGVEYRPNQETVGSWISFVKNEGDTKYTLVVDPAKMDNYFSFLGSKINAYSTERVVRVENGVKQTEVQAGVNGLLVDTRLLGEQISATLPNQASIRLEIPTYVDQYKTRYTNVVIADWDKYIDINLSTQKMIACEKGGVNCHEWSVTTGKDGSSTPTGTFLVLGRSANFYMTGGTVGIDYYKVWVDRAVWFTGAGHAIHDAAWRNGSFGGQDYHWNGSHGCVNSPDDAATYIYNWASVGTPVIIHY